MSLRLHASLLLALVLIGGCSGSESRSESKALSEAVSSGETRAKSTAPRGASATGRVPPPGHSGPVPSPAAQGIFRELRGREFEHPATGEVWIVQGFAVIPNPVTGKGPVAMLERDGATIYLQVLTDADVEDLAHRIDAGRPRPQGALSSEYQNALSRE